jgi:ribonuclease E
MSKSMLIDASHPEETRVVVVNDRQLEEFDFEPSTKKQLKGNIYLAKITRVEPSLQAAFVDYGGERHGFLAFSEIHPDYYQIPQADRALLTEATAAEDDPAEAETGDQDAGEPNGADADPAEAVSTDPDEETEEVIAEQARRRQRLLRNYKIQEVIKRRQFLLVQVVKEEGGTRGAGRAASRSLAGRYCVLMPNTARGGGISRKIADMKDRSRLKTIARDLEVPEGMGLIVRTAGQSRNRQEIRRDYDYLLRLWSDIRDRTLESIAPCIIHEEGALVKRAIRDIYDSDIGEILVEGDEGYKSAKKFMTMFMPSRARRVKQYKEEQPLFHHFRIEEQLDALHSPIVELRSGGSIVINPTEALTAIDVNSGRSTRERNIEETAVKTNCEAAEEIARQLRLRDLAGLVVIDFIDMTEMRNQRTVERRLRDALRFDRARIQLGRISAFGLLELSRQRLRPSLLELSTQPCPVCAGSGTVRSVESATLQALRMVEIEGMKGASAAVAVTLPLPVVLYMLNQKRDQLVSLEQRYGMAVEVRAGDDMIAGNFKIETIDARSPQSSAKAEVAAPAVAAEAPSGEVSSADEDDSQRKRRRRRRRRRRGEGAEDEAASSSASGEGSGEKPVEVEAPAEPQPVEADGGEEGDDEAGESGSGRRRRRGGTRSRRRGSGRSAGGRSPAPIENGADQPRLESFGPTDGEVMPAAEAPSSKPQTADANGPVPAEALVDDDDDQVGAPEPVTAQPAAGADQGYAPQELAAARHESDDDEEDDAETAEQSEDAFPSAATIHQPEEAPRRGWWNRLVRK